MTTAKFSFDRVLQALRRQRDESILQMHLAKAEARDAWRKAEKKWERQRPKLNAAASEALDTGGNVRAALQLSVEELRRGYARISKLLR